MLKHTLPFQLTCVYQLLIMLLNSKLYLAVSYFGDFCLFLPLAPNISVLQYQLLYASVAIWLLIWIPKEPSGSVVECSTQDQEVSWLSLTGGTGRAVAQW